MIFLLKIVLELIFGGSMSIQKFILFCLEHIALGAYKSASRHQRENHECYIVADVHEYNVIYFVEPTLLIDHSFFLFNSLLTKQSGIYII